MKRCVALTLVPVLAVTGCIKPAPAPVLEPLPPVTGEGAIAPPRVNGSVGTAERDLAGADQHRGAGHLAPPSGRRHDKPGSDHPGLRGLRHTGGGVADPRRHPPRQLHDRSGGARNGHIAYGDNHDAGTARGVAAVAACRQQRHRGRDRRCLPGGAGPRTGGDRLVGGNDAAVPLRYASAAELAKILQPFVQTGGKIAADTNSNALIVVGDPATREALIGLIRAFDVDSLAGQSYALLPVTVGDAQDTAAALQVAFRSQSNGALAGVVRVVPMQSDQFGAVDCQPARLHRRREAGLCPGGARTPDRRCGPGASFTSRTAAATTWPMCCSRPSRPAMSRPSRRRPASAVPPPGPRPAPWAAVAAWAAVAWVAAAWAAGAD